LFRWFQITVDLIDLRTDFIVLSPDSWATHALENFGCMVTFIDDETLTGTQMPEVLPLRSIVEACEVLALSLFSLES
jgi:hypothetical protein